MPDRRRTTCRTCHGHARDVGTISWRGNCVECAVQLEEQANWGQHFKTGPVMDVWRRSMILCAGGILPERLETRS